MVGKSRSPALYAFSAANKTLPLPSYARVTNLANGKSVIVRVNDRGPFHEGRIIDLSYAAAVKLGVDVGAALDKIGTAVDNIDWTRFQAGFDAAKSVATAALDVLKQVKAAAVGVTTASFWSSALDNQANRTLATTFAQAYQDETGAPLVVDGYVVQMWDAMTALDLALQATNGSPASGRLITALEGVAFKSPRGDFSFDKVTHNVVQDIYIQVVRASGGSVANEVVGTIPKVSDPGR